MHYINIAINLLIQLIKFIINVSTAFLDKIIHEPGVRVSEVAKFPVS